MSKVTSKHQVSIPKALAARAGIRIGDELKWEHAAGGACGAAATGVGRARISTGDERAG